MKKMSHLDALELVELRMREDFVSWAVATKEYMSLTGYSLRGCIDVANHLRDYSVKLRTGQAGKRPDADQPA